MNKLRFAQLLSSIGIVVACHNVVAAEAKDDIAPFPPGPNALLVKQTCSQCHSPNVVVTQTFSEESARKVYKKMMGESPDTERGKKVVEYLATVLGEKND